MTLPPKRPLYNFLSFIIFAFILLACLFFAVTARISPLAFILISTLLVSLLLSFREFRHKILRGIRGKLDKLDERVNLLNEVIREKKKILNVIPATCENISYLFDASAQLIGLGEPDEVFDFLIHTSAQLFPAADNILMFSLHKDTLQLTRSFKRVECVIGEKCGDILDTWVIKNNHSLFVEDLTQEFRFDYHKTITFKERETHSVIASPLSIAERILGVVRVESKKPYAFSLDDSRLLRSVCDLGVVVLERANLLRNMEELAIRDPLTGLFLRDYFFSRLKDEAHRAVTKHAPLGVLMFDIDDFKSINDTHGHIVGDIVLKRVAKILREIIGETGNVLCRFGGEEFIALLAECNKERVVTIAGELRRAIEETVVSFRRKDICFTISIGALAYPALGLDALGLLDAVDKLLYKAKREGKNRVCVYGQ